MRLFRFEEYRLKMSEEALAIKAFRDIWERDKSKDKGRAIAELGYIYFFCDPRSDYMFLVDEKTRAAKIKEQEGLDKKWKPDEKVEAAMDVYKYLIDTEGSLLLKDTRELVSKMRAELKAINFRGCEEKDKLVMIEKAARTVKMIPGLLKDLADAERTVFADIEEDAEARGEAVKHLFEDGFEGLQ